MRLRECVHFKRVAVRQGSYFAATIGAQESNAGTRVTLHCIFHRMDELISFAGRNYRDSRVYRGDEFLNRRRVASMMRYLQEIGFGCGMIESPENCHLQLAKHALARPHLVSSAAISADRFRACLAAAINQHRSAVGEGNEDGISVANVEGAYFQPAGFKSWCKPTRRD
jgi:hypothetical protein